MTWSPDNSQPLLSTQEDRRNESATIRYTVSTDSSAPGVVESSWTWSRGDLPPQVEFVPSADTLTVVVPHWDGLFLINVVYQRNFVTASATSWAAVPSDAMIVDFEPSPINRKEFPFDVTFSYRTGLAEPTVSVSQTYRIEVFANYDVGKGQVQARTVNKAGRPVGRKGDSCTGHGCFPPRLSTSGSPDVFINGVPVLRVSDGWSVHSCGRESHDGVQADGADFVFVNNLRLARVGDAVSCGSAVAEGADFVYCD